ncbi:MAG TPA: protein kinase, partial [Gemmatimonadaceae bacterium]|nr:protein kinase [Gemmatimonadaceae bacterium]
MDSTGALNEALAGHYAIERELGRGGMAHVYLARDVRHDRLVALKLLNPELGAAVGAERFLREIQVVGRLRHPHIVPLYDSGEAAGHVYYVMPYVKGESVRERIARSGPLPSEEAARLVAEVAEALEYAHSEGVVHRDIKPDNIMLDERHALVMDFGIARALSAGTSDTLTGTGLLVGTPAYMSPEQAAGDPVDARSDIYSLGCVLYEMLSGKPPFTGATAHAVMAQRFAKATPSLDALAKTTSPTLQAVVSKSMSLMPDERYQTASEMVAAIDAARTSPSISSRAVRPARVWWKRIEFIGMGAAILILVAAAAYGKLRSRPATGDDSAGSDMHVASIGVLPFANQSGDKQMEYFSDGLTDELISALSHVAGLQVAGRASSFSIKGKNLDAREAARRLQVAYVVDAGVRSAGSRVRVTWQLSDGNTGRGLGSGDIDGDMKDVIALQDSMATKIVEGLSPVIGISTSTAVPKHQTANFEAHDLYMKGHFYWNQRTAETMRQGIAYLKQAIAKDPNYALAWAELSSAYTLEPSFGDMRPAEAMQPARDAAKKALELDPTLSEANVAMGMSLMFNDWDPKTALHYVEKAIALDPRNSFPHLFRVWPLVMLGRGDDAIAEIKRARALDPLSPILNTRVGTVFIMMKKFPEAEAELRKVVIADPANVLARFELGTSLTVQGKHAEALAAYPDA